MLWFSVKRSRNLAIFFHRRMLRLTTQSAIWVNQTGSNGIPIDSPKTRPKVPFFVQSALKTINIMDQFLAETIFLVNYSHISPLRKLCPSINIFIYYLYFNWLYDNYQSYLSLEQHPVNISDIHRLNANLAEKFHFRIIFPAIVT